MSQQAAVDHPLDSARRDFIFRVGTGLGLAAIAYQGAASLRSLVPNVSYDAPTVVKIGLASEFVEGLKFLPGERLFVFREANTFHAISAVCTHLGCTARAEALMQPETKQADGRAVRITHRFLCPCHGSKYDGEGINVAGPAPRPLAWYELSVASDDGQLVVDLAKEVGRDFRLTV